MNSRAAYKSWMESKLVSSNSMAYFPKFYGFLTNLSSDPDPYLEVFPMWIRNIMLNITQTNFESCTWSKVAVSFLSKPEWVGRTGFMCTAGYFLKIAERDDATIIEKLKFRASDSSKGLQFIQFVNPEYIENDEYLQSIPEEIRRIMLYHIEYDSLQTRINIPPIWDLRKKIPKYHAALKRWAIQFGFDICSALIED